MNRVRLLSLLCLPLLGCVTTIGLPIEDRTRVYEDDFDTVFKAVARALDEEGYYLVDTDYWGGVIETGELFNADRRELSRVLASVSEWEDGTHLLLIYVLEDAFRTVEAFELDCGPLNFRRRYLYGVKPSFAYICTRKVLYWETYLMPSLAKPKAQKYYNDLFVKIEASM